MAAPKTAAAISNTLKKQTEGFQWRVPLAIALVLIASLFLVNCRATPTPPPPVHLRIGTADSTQYIARETANAYRRAHPGATFDFYTSNSTTALRQLSFGQFDFAFIERNPHSDELERAKGTALELGRDGVFVIVNPINTVTNISRADLQKVLTGEINTWSALGIPPPNGRDEIQVLMREEGSGMRAVIEDNILQGGRVTPTALLQPTNLEMLDYVADHSNAIGYVAANIWDGNTRTHAIGIDNVAATRGNIRSGTYPLLQSVFLIVPQEPNDDISSFVDFLASQDGRETLYQRIAEIPPK